MAGLKDVARLAGVSPSTVSYFLNGKKRVKPETEERILAAVDKLNYQPNRIARCLKMGVSRVIGIVAADLSNAYYMDVLSGMSRVLRENGYTYTLYDSWNDKKAEEDNLRNLSGITVDGIIVIGTGLNDIKTKSECAVPVVCVDQMQSGGLMSVAVNNMYGGYLGMEYLLGKKKKRVVFAGSSERASLAERFEGCKKACVDEGLDPEQYLLYHETVNDSEGGYRAVTELLSEGQLSECDAVFAGTDNIAYGVLKALHDSGISVPDQIGVMGFDDLNYSRYTIPALTTIRQPRKEIGEAAVNMLFDAMEKKEDIGFCRIEPSLTIRESV